MTNIFVQQFAWDSITFRWNPAVDPDGDRVIHMVDLFGTKAGETNVMVYSLPSLSGEITFTGLPPISKFSVKVRATDGVYWTESSLFRNLVWTTAPPPEGKLSTPTDLKVVGMKNGRALVSWNMPQWSGPIHFFPEIRSLTEPFPGPWVNLPGVRTFNTVVTNIFGTDKVEVRLRASNGSDLSAYSPSIKFSGADLTNSASLTITGVSAGSITSKTAVLSWSESSGPLKDPLSYEIEYKLEGAEEWIAAGTRNTNWFTLQGLTPDSTYTARVRAGDGEEWGNWTTTFLPFKTLPPNSGVLSAPFPITISQISSNSVSVTWQNADGPAGAALIYELELGQDVGHGYYGYKSIGLWTETNAVLSLNPNSLYSLRIRTRYQNLTSNWSYVESLFRTLPVSGPGTLPGVTNYRVTHVGATTIQLNWNATTDRFSTNLQYEILSRSGTQLTNFLTTSTNLFLEDLEPDTQYTFNIRTVDGSRIGGWSQESIITRTLISPDPVPPVNPLPPAATDFTTTSATVSWGEAKDYNADSVTYELQWRRRLHPAVEEWNAANSVILKETSTKVYGLVPGALYDLRVRATDGTFTTPWIESEGALVTLSSSRQLLFNHPAIEIDGIVTEEGTVLTWRADYYADIVLEESEIGQVNSWVASSAPVRKVQGYYRSVIDRNSPPKQYRVRAGSR